MEPTVILINQDYSVHHYLVTAEVNGVVVQGVVAALPNSYDAITHEPAWSDLPEIRVAPFVGEGWIGGSLIYKDFAGMDVVIASQARRVT